jgi:uncharacterized membrane protein YdcZ (DUF606 family)
VHHWSAGWLLGVVFGDLIRLRRTVVAIVCSFEVIGQVRAGMLLDNVTWFAQVKINCQKISKNYDEIIINN